MHAEVCRCKHARHQLLAFGPCPHGHVLIDVAGVAITLGPLASACNCKVM
jgi:hypothetical protein